MVPHLSTHHSAQPHNKHSTCSSVSFLILCFCAFSSSTLSSTPSMSYVHAHKDGQYTSARIVKPHHFLPYTCIHICIYSRTHIACIQTCHRSLHPSTHIDHCALQMVHPKHTYLQLFFFVLLQGSNRALIGSNRCSQLLDVCCSQGETPLKHWQLRNRLSLAITMSIIHT